jgi:hypothetical protein
MRGNLVVLVVPLQESVLIRWQLVQSSLYCTVLCILLFFTLHFTLNSIVRVLVQVLSTRTVEWDCQYYLERVPVVKVESNRANVIL